MNFPILSSVTLLPVLGALFILFSKSKKNENKINKAPRAGSKVIDERIGKFILFNHQIS